MFILLDQCVLSHAPLPYVFQNDKCYQMAAGQIIVFPLSKKIIYISAASFITGKTN